MVEGTAYQVRVTAVNEVGVGEPSPVSESFTPMAPTSEIPSIRKGLTTDESIELKWAAPEDQGALGMKGYLIQLQVSRSCECRCLIYILVFEEPVVGKPADGARRRRLGRLEKDKGRA